MKYTAKVGFYLAKMKTTLKIKGKVLAKEGQVWELKSGIPLSTYFAPTVEFPDFRLPCIDCDKSEIIDLSKEKKAFLAWETIEAEKTEESSQKKKALPT